MPLIAFRNVEIAAIYVASAGFIVQGKPRHFIGVSPSDGRGNLQIMRSKRCELRINRKINVMALAIRSRKFRLPPRLLPEDDCGSRIRIDLFDPAFEIRCL